MNNKLSEGLNKQLNLELYSAYLYFGMSAYFYEINMDGFARVIKKQAKEELSHAKKIYNFLISTDEKIVLYDIKTPDMNWINPIDGIKSALNHEKEVTSSIEKLYFEAKELKNCAVEIFLHWFVKEQIEEEEKFRKILAKMENIQNYDCEIVDMDREFEQK